MGSIQTFEDLTNKGFDVQEGIKLCGGDEAIYMEVLWAAMVEGQEKIPLIRSVYEEKDFERYRIEVHGLKNAMRSIGANYLSQLAAEQEQAAKNENYSVMKVGVQELLEQYQFVIEALKELLGEM
ncbi:MAG: Hpt domain-containing protein [Lachnospiraceae bacterium]|nr:Hpt domain-containing protein [Lachnospiraceae bacterium]